MQEEMKALKANEAKSKEQTLPLNNFSNDREMLLDLICDTIDVCDRLTPEGILEEWLEYNK
jgi:hypothetical protein